MSWNLNFPAPMGSFRRSFWAFARAQASFGGTNRRGVMLIGEFYQPVYRAAGSAGNLDGMALYAEYSLACAVNGQVFRDDLGEFTRIRRELEAGYPEDVRRKENGCQNGPYGPVGPVYLERSFKGGESGERRHWRFLNLSRTGCRFCSF